MRVINLMLTLCSLFTLFSSLPIFPSSLLVSFWFTFIFLYLFYSCVFFVIYFTFSHLSQTVSLFFLITVFFFPFFSNPSPIPSLSCVSTPSSLRSVPSTPVTPCRLSMGESFSPRRTTVPPAGLAKLLLEKGISAQKVPVPSKLPQPLHLPPSTPPNSPCPSPVPFESTSTLAENFLASRPAELFLQDVYGVKHDLLERLRKLGLDKNVIRTDSDSAHPSSTLLPTGGGSLLVGLRRNQSLPAMVCKRSPSYPAPPPHPTSLALPTPTWGNLKPRPTRRHASLSQAPLSHEH